LVCSNCDWIGSLSIDEPDECPKCGLPAADMLSPTGCDDEDEPEELRA
jgi:hypothetical protein